MTDGASLLAAVIASPDDDDVRLVYSDWLEENGQPERAEFIRVQIERANLSSKSRKRKALVAREEELVARWADTWLSPLPAWARPLTNEYNLSVELLADEHNWFGYRRGFLQGVVPPEKVTVFLRDAPTVFATEPITHLYLSDDEYLDHFPDSPELLGLAGLRFGHYTLGDDGAVALSRLPALPRLRQLRLYKNEIGNRGLKALAKWPGLATVEELELGFNDFNGVGLKGLLASPYLGSLKRLDLSDSLIAEKTKVALRDRFGDIVEV